MDYTQIFKEIHDKLQHVENPGHVADYIPELAKISPHYFGVHLSTVRGEKYGFGDFERRFSLQSISKVLSFVLAYSQLKSDTWHRMDLEPAGTPFNSLVQLEYDKGIPRNPFINAGAIVVADILVSTLQNPKQELISFVRRLANNPSIDYNHKVAESEKTTGFRNYALVNLMKSFGNIHNDIDAVMELYFSLCAIEMSCEELTKTFLFLANNGVVPYSGERILSPSRTKRVNALMQTCGFYDEAGQFTFKVGLPGKSGVGGGIVAILPQQYSIAVYSPPLNQKGNSYMGILFLEEFTTKTEISIF